MRILFCCQLPLNPRQGVPKHFLELASSFRASGWDARVAGPADICPGAEVPPYPEFFSPHLRKFLQATAGDFDVVEYDHTLLPYPRADFPASTLMVARSMLLIHHLMTAGIPDVPTLRARIGRLLFGRKRRRWAQTTVAGADECIRQADLTIVCNDRDAAQLIAGGHSPTKLVTMPLGISNERRPLFDAVSPQVPSGPPTVGFVGTFDPRKGMCDFPQLVDRVVARIPDVRFRLMGTAGMVPDAAGVLGFLPKRLRERIEVLPRYEPDHLPKLLADCSVGVFPSIAEGFPFGVLEMMAAAVPVAAYDAPGAHALVPPELLSSVRDVPALADSVIGMLLDPIRLSAARLAAREISRRFVWEDIARQTAEIYVDRIGGRDCSRGGRPGL